MGVHLCAKMIMIHCETFLCTIQEIVHFIKVVGEVMGTKEMYSEMYEVYMLMHLGGAEMHSASVWLKIFYKYYIFL